MAIKIWLLSSDKQPVTLRLQIQLLIPLEVQQEASTMIGCSCTTEENYTICHWCTFAAHMLNLASSQAGESVPYIKKFNVIIRHFVNFYANSAIRTAGLEAC